MSWKEHAACRDRADIDWFVMPRSGRGSISLDQRREYQREVNRAKAVCMTCPVRSECLNDALSVRGAWANDHGIWGGTTREERIVIRRRRRAS